MVPGARPGAGGPALRLSAELDRLSAACGGQAVTLRELLPGLDPRDQALLTATLSICFLHPIPMPGLSTFFGLVIALAGTRMALGLGPWVPQRWLGRPLPARTAGKVFAAAARAVRRCERVVRPRGRFISARAWTARANGAGIAVCGLLLAAPALPGTNFPPAAAALLLSIGTLETDLAFLAAGWLALALNLAFFGAIAWLGWSGVRALL